MEIAREEIIRFDLHPRCIVVRTSRPNKVIAVMREFQSFYALRERILAWNEIPASVATPFTILRQIGFPLATGVSSMAGVWLIILSTHLWLNCVGLGLVMIFDTMLTVRISRANQTHLALRIIMLLSLWLPLPALVFLVALQHSSR
jgi:hypothetical protein